jgi:hypothetical protein
MERESAAAAWTPDINGTDQDLIREFFGLTNQVARLKDELDELSLRLDAVVGTAGRRWVPDAYAVVDAEELAAYGLDAEES